MCLTTILQSRPLKGKHGKMGLFHVCSIVCLKVVTVKIMTKRIRLVVSEEMDQKIYTLWLSNWSHGTVTFLEWQICKIKQRMIV